MRERALNIGGQLSVSTVDGGGTEVRLDVPLPRGVE
jgi:signal transduction histidine kinase